MKYSRILLVDDDDDDQFIFLDVVKDITEGIECVIANNGLEALRLLRSGTPAPGIIFLDLNMPFISGFECLQRIKKDESLNTIPVIILTTSNNDSDRKKAKEFGAEMFLTKTPDLKLLRQQLLEIFNADF